MKRKTDAFQFRKFSRRQKQLLTWWRPWSPYYEHDTIICDGSIRSGKTVAMILSFLLWTQTSFDDSKNFIIAGKTMGALKKNVINPLLAICRAIKLKPKYIRSGADARIEIGRHTYYLYGASNEAAQDTLQGLTAAGALLDEAALFPRSFVEQAIGRCSEEGSRIWMNCNPGGPYHYLKTEYIDQAKKKKILHIHFTLDDNLTLSPKIKERYHRMYTGVFFRRYILGLWVAAEGAIYDMFDKDVHVVDELPQMTQYWVCGDYGTTNPTVFHLVGLGIDDVYYVIDEWRWDSKKKGRQKTDSEYADDLEEFVESYNIYPSDGVFDPSAASFMVELRGRSLRFTVRKADNDVLDGIRRVGTLLQLARLKFHRRCKGTIMEMVGYIWDAKAEEHGEDAPVKQNDHGPDAVRYLINFLSRKTELVSWT